MSHKDERASTGPRLVQVGPVRPIVSEQWFNRHPQSSSYPEQQQPLFTLLAVNYKTLTSSPSAHGTIDPTPNPVFGPPAAPIHSYTPTNLSPMNSLRAGNRTASSLSASPVPHDRDESKSQSEASGGVAVAVNGKVKSTTKQTTDGSKQVHVGEGDQSTTSCCNQVSCCIIM